jgi:hypothetical protein
MVLDRIKKIYPIVYGKSIIPKFKLLRKEFAKGNVVEVVKKILVNWASFGHETSTNQHEKWQSKLDTLIVRKASILGMDVVEVKRELKVMTL